MKQLVIDRSRWLRGNPDDSCLLDRNGKMCCLGFYLKSCGAADVELLEAGSPACLTHHPRPAKWLVVNVARDDLHEATQLDSNRCTALMQVNDSVEWTDENREREIAHLFHRQGIEVEFVDGSVPPIGTATGK
jgi:hypothetical protein